MANVLIQWAIRIVLALLAFVLVKVWPLPLLLGLVGLTVPDQVLTLLAVLVALLVLAGHYYYWGRTPPAP